MRVAYACKHLSLSINDRRRKSFTLLFRREHAHSTSSPALSVYTYVNATVLREKVGLDIPVSKQVPQIGETHDIVRLPYITSLMPVDLLFILGY